jgi:hypothetical protein
MHSQLRTSMLSCLFNDRIRRLPIIINCLPDKTQMCLDIGCFGGYFSQHLPPKNNNYVISIDISRFDVIKS